MPTGARSPEDQPATSDGRLPSAVDVLIVGGGPAGLSAATWTGRYRRSTPLVDAGRQRNLPAHAPDPAPPTRYFTRAES